LNIKTDSDTEQYYQLKNKTDNDIEHHRQLKIEPTVILARVWFRNHMGWVGHIPILKVGLDQFHVWFRGWSHLNFLFGVSGGVG